MFVTFKKAPSSKIIARKNFSLQQFCECANTKIAAFIARKHSSDAFKHFHIQLSNIQLSLQYLVFHYLIFNKAERICGKGTVVQEPLPQDVCNVV